VAITIASPANVLDRSYLQRKEENAVTEQRITPVHVYLEYSLLVAEPTLLTSDA
jgi:hypothetical protein